MDKKTECKLTNDILFARAVLPSQATSTYRLIAPDAPTSAPIGAHCAPSHMHPDCLRQLQVPAHNDFN